jgi:hypothetical protein
MANHEKPKLLAELKARYGSIRKLDASQSLFELGDGAMRLYLRYSKLHKRNEAFYGLRSEDLQKLEGMPAVICFLWDGQVEPLFVPFSEYEEVFKTCSPAKDGQYKVMVYPEKGETEIYIPKAGRFNGESYYGYQVLDGLIDDARLKNIPDFTHSQIQTLIGAVGVSKGYDIWIPQKDRFSLDWSLTKTFKCRRDIPASFESVRGILQEVDVVWIQPGSSELKVLFEVEHSTPIYSGLLRFNDVHLVAPKGISRFTIVSNDVRRSLFVRQINRPTFRTSGLSELCTFLEYANVYGWFNRVAGKQQL